MIRGKLIKWSVRTIGMLLFLLSAMVLFSPYGARSDRNGKAIIVETEIDAPRSKVFDYLGRSYNASRWSTFVRKIKTLNSDHVADGDVGSKRRCYGNQDGIEWDEEILYTQQNEQRLLNVYNAKGFAMMADDILTEQIYEEVTDNKTRLKFSLFFKEGKRNIFSELKMYFAAYVVADIFQGNLANIKKYNEQAQS